MKKNHLILLIVLIFIISIAVRYYPILRKGHPGEISVINLILARNLSFANKYSFENEKNVVLSSSLVAENGIPASTSNRLTPIIYSKIFDIFGFRPDFPLYISIILYGITTVLLFLLILRLFSCWAAVIFAIIDIFIPFVSAASIWFGTYEWAMLFFVIALFIYLWKEKPNYWRLILAGLFFGLASLARNAFLISFIIFIFYEIYSNFIYKKEWRIIKQWLWPALKRVLVLALPVILLWGGFILKDNIQGNINRYLIKENAGYDEHLFPDPYTYHFEKANFIDQIKQTAQGDEISALIDYGYLSGWKVRAKMHLISFIYYFKSFFRLPTLGGALIIFFLVLGSVYLFKFRRNLLILAIFWIMFLFLVLLSFNTSNDDHFLEIRFPLVLMISLGIYWMLNWLREAIKNKKVYYLLTLGIISVLCLHLIEADKWLFHEKYSQIDQKIELRKSIEEKKSTLNYMDVIAVSVPQSVYYLSYYTDLSYIYFAPETINELLRQNKLQWAFNQFGVTKIVGYDKYSAEEIMRQAVSVQNISSY